jgi:hypothetical protein
MSDSPKPSDSKSTGVISRVQVTEGIVAAVMSAAIIGSATGVFWLVTSLPNQLDDMKRQMVQILKNQDAFGERFIDLEKDVNDLDRRIIKLELRR